MSWSINRLLLPFCSALFLLACEKPTEIGPPNQPQLGVFFTDEQTIQTSTVLLDSVISADSAGRANNTLLAGYYADPVFGNIKAQSFFTIGQLQVFNPGDNPVCDSLLLILPYNYYYGDTTKLQNLQVYRLSDTLNYYRKYYYTDAVAYDNALLGSKSFFPTPRTNDTLSIKLNEEMNATLGHEILNLPTLSNDATAFRKYFKGLTLKSDESGNSILGFGGGTLLRMYFHNTDSDSLSNDFFLFYPFFNQVTANRSTSQALQQLNNQNRIVRSDPTTNEAYLQSLLGVATKIEFPDLKKLKDLGRIGINQAQLVIKTKANSSNNNLGAPFNVVLTETNSTNRISTNANGPIYVQTEGSGVFGAQSPQVAPLSQGKYIFTMTSYLQAMLAGIDAPATGGITGKKPNDGLLLLPIGAQTIQGAIINGNNNIKLRVYYTHLNQ